MKKSLTIITICFLAFLTLGCTKTTDNDIPKLNNKQGEDITEKELFDQKVTCSNKTDDVLKIIDRYNGENTINQESFEEIFYSPTLNTCLYASHYTMIINGETYATSYDIGDALTQENIFHYSLLDYDENYINDSLTYLKAVNYARNTILKSKIEELKK